MVRRSAPTTPLYQTDSGCIIENRPVHLLSMKRRFVLSIALVGALFFFSYHSLTTLNHSILDSKVITVVNKDALSAVAVKSFSKIALAEPKEIRDDELLPDLVPLPARDLTIKKEKGEEGKTGKTLLLFSTTYYNQVL